MASGLHWRLRYCSHSLTEEINNVERYIFRSGQSEFDCRITGCHLRIDFQRRHLTRIFSFHSRRSASDEPVWFVNRKSKLLEGQFTCREIVEVYGAAGFAGERQRFIVRRERRLICIQD